jgi:hypothetical protein
MLSLAQTNREKFNKAFPPVASDQRHLLRTLTPPEKRPEVEKPPVSFSELTAKLMSDKGLGYADAQAEASAILAGKKTYDSVGKKK